MQPPSYVGIDVHRRRSVVVQLGPDGIEADVRHGLDADKGYWAVQALPGVGPVLSAVFVAEVGDVTRFASAAKLCSWAGLTPRHRESDATVVRGHITKQSPALVRWAAVEAISRNRGGTFLQSFSHRVATERSSRNIGRVAAVRKLLTLVYYGLRDGEIRCLAAPA